MAKRFYEDARFLVTASDIRTPNTFYPVADTVGHLRRDPLYAGASFAALMLLGLLVYGDLLRGSEILVMLALSASALWIGARVAVLQLDARGFPSRVYLGSLTTMRTLFDAITEARAAAVGARGGLDEAAVEHGRD